MTTGALLAYRIASVPPTLLKDCGSLAVLSLQVRARAALALPQGVPSASPRQAAATRASVLQQCCQVPYCCAEKAVLDCVCMCAPRPHATQDNPITADQLRSTPGFKDYDARRVSAVAAVSRKSSRRAQPAAKQRVVTRKQQPVPFLQSVAAVRSASIMNQSVVISKRAADVLWLQVALCNKQLDAKVSAHATRTFTEGAEDRQWQRYASGQGGGGGQQGGGR